MPGSKAGAVVREVVAYYDNERYHESLDNVTPADAYFGRKFAVVSERLSRIRSEFGPPNSAPETNADRGVFQARNARSPVRIHQGPLPKPRAITGFWGATPSSGRKVSATAD